MFTIFNKSSPAFISVVSASLLILAGTVSAVAGNPGQCASYANKAVAQNGANLSHHCNFHGPRWQSKFGVHFTWCIASPTSAINAERSARQHQLNTCINSGPVVKYYSKPKIGGLRLDWCRKWASQCGGPAANAYCHSKGYNHAVSWSKANDIGTWTSTRVISTGQVCSQNVCDGFKWIRCSN